MPENSMPKEAAYQIVSDELMLDGNPRLNLASFVTTWMEPECDNLIMSSINKNYVDMDEYPVTTELQVVNDLDYYGNVLHFFFFACLVIRLFLGVLCYNYWRSRCFVFCL